MGGACRVADAVSRLVQQGGVVAFVGRAVGVGVGERFAVGVSHPYLFAEQTGFFGYVGEGEVSVVAVHGVEVAGVVGLADEEVVFVNHVGDEYVRPAVVVNVGAGYRGGGAQVGAVGEGGIGDVGEGAVAVVDEKPVGVSGRDGAAVFVGEVGGAEVEAVALYAASADI